jgi:uncharacterized protein YjiS (DUF1127 family)
MTYVDFGIARTVKRLLSDFTAYREEMRTERHISTLPEHILKDIGWPDAYAERLARRGSMEEKEAGTTSASSGLAPWQLGWPKARQPKKVSKSGYFGLEC